MSDVTVKNLTAYQRWELPTFDMVKVVDVVPTVAQLEHIQQQAHEEGYDAGFAKGYAEGAQKALDEEQKARDEAQNSRDEAQCLMKIIGALENELQQMDQQVSQNLLDLSMEVAKQMLHQALKIKPDLLLGVVGEAISELPHFNQHAHLVLHPADAELVRANMGEQLTHTDWKIFEDTQMERGGCRVETAHSQIDATLATRWKRVVSSIGQDNSWLEP